jgi:hypothetical protein
MCPNLLRRALVLGLLASASEIQATTVAEVVAGSPLAGRESEILAGGEVTAVAHRSGEREMAVALACLVPAGQPTSLAMFRHDRAIMPDEYRDADGPIDPADPEGSLAALTLGGNAQREARRYLEAAPGWELSLSSREIEQLRALEPSPGGEVEAVEGALRRLFAKRVRAYHEHGLAGVEAFDRGDGSLSSAATDLDATTRASQTFARILPETHRVLLAFPGGAPPDGEVFYFWTRINVLGRPVFLLNQRLVGSPDGIPVMIERQFYATQFLGAGQTLTALVPVSEGTLVFYVNHSFVDRWSGSGFAAGAKRQVGQQLIEAILPEMAESLGLCAGGSSPSLE